MKDEVDIHAYLWTLYIARFNIEYANTLWRAGVEETDRFICKEVKTMCGPLEVSFAVYNDGVEAQLEVALVNWNALDGVEAFGTVDSGNSNMPGTKARSRLFDKSINEAIHVKPGNDVTSLPLSRSVTVIPRGSTLFVRVSIWRLENSCRHQQPIFQKLSFDAVLAGTEMKVAYGDRGNVEVRVTWSG